MWMSNEHAARLAPAARAELAERATLTELGRGLRINVDPTRPRRDMEALIPLLGSLLPAETTVEAYKLERAAALAASTPAAVPAERVIDKRS
jgi:hypothetical protein